MRRREFIAALGGVVALPSVAKSQTRMPVVGFVDPRSPDGMADRLRAFRQGLKEGGYVEGENLVIEYRWAENQMDRLPVLVADLVAQQVAVIVTPGGVVTTMAAKSATTMVPMGAAGALACAMIQVRAMKAATPPMTMAIERTRTLLLRIFMPHLIERATSSRSRLLRSCELTPKACPSAPRDGTGAASPASPSAAAVRAGPFSLPE